MHTCLHHWDMTKSCRPRMTQKVIHPRLAYFLSKRSLIRREDHNKIPQREHQPVRPGRLGRPATGGTKGLRSHTIPASYTVQLLNHNWHRAGGLIAKETNQPLSPGGGHRLSQELPAELATQLSTAATLLPSTAAANRATVPCRCEGAAAANSRAYAAGPIWHHCRVTSSADRKPPGGENS